MMVSLRPDEAAVQFFAEQLLFEAFGRDSR